MGGEFGIADLPPAGLLGLGPFGFEIDLLQERARPHIDRRLALQHLLLQFGRPAARWLPEIAMQHFDHRCGEGDFAVRILDIGAGEVLAHHHQGHVADDLRGRRDLDDIAEHVVDDAVGLRDLDASACRGRWRAPVP